MEPVWTHPQVPSSGNCPPLTNIQQSNIQTTTRIQAPKVSRRLFVDWSLRSGAFLVSGGWSLILDVPLLEMSTLASQSILELPPPPDGEKMSYGSGEFQFGELRVPAGAGPHPVAIVIHGGYWRAAYGLRHIGHLCAALTKAGVATWSLEYRRVGNPGGGWPGTFDDIRDGAKHIRQIAV